MRHTPEKMFHFVWAVEAPNLHPDRVCLLPATTLSRLAITVFDKIISAYLVRASDAKVAMLVKMLGQDIISTFKHRDCQDDLLIFFPKELLNQLHIPIASDRIDQLIYISYQICPPRCDGPSGLVPREPRVTPYFQTSAIPHSLYHSLFHQLNTSQNTPPCL